MTTSVPELLRERSRDASTPGQRTDSARLALVIEGGSSRGAYSSGMTVAIEQLGLLPLFDAVYGSSAGALNAAWLLCGRAESTMHAWWNPAIMRGTMTRVGPCSVGRWWTPGSSSTPSTPSSW